MAQSPVQDVIFFLNSGNLDIAFELAGATLVDGIGPEISRKLQQHLRAELNLRIIATTAFQQLTRFITRVVVDLPRTVMSIEQVSEEVSSNKYLKKVIILNICLR